MTNRDIIVPPLFYTVVKGEGPVSPYGNSGASAHILDAYIRLWQLTQYQLAGLLGMYYRNNFYRYMDGDRRPSSLMCLRLLQLELLHRQGLELFRIRVIDWESDPIQIFWNNNTASSPDKATGRWAKMPRPEDGAPVPHGASGLALQRQSREPRQPKRKHYVQRGSYK